MKKNVCFVFFCILSFLLTARASAAPAYGTKMPEKDHFSIGGQTHVVVERNLEGGNGEINSLQHFFLVSYGLLDWLSVDFKGGAGDVENNRFQADQIKYPAFMAGGYGFRVRLYEKDELKIVAGFQHISVHPYSIFITNSAGDNHHKAVIDDWQFSCLGSYQVRRFTPYAGLKVSRMDLIYWRNGERNRIKSDLSKSVGLVTGLDVDLTGHIWLNMEGQFLDGQSASASLNYRF